MTNPATPPTAMAETPLGSRASTRSHGTLPAVAMILASCVSLQFGAALAMQLFPELGSWGVTTLRLLLAAGVLLLVARPRILGWSRRQWMHVLLFGVAIAGMNGFFFASIALIPLGPAVAIESHQSTARKSRRPPRKAPCGTIARNSTSAPRRYS